MSKLTKREWLAWYLTNQIRAGELKPGQKLPSVAQMQIDYKISREGIWWAKKQLRDRSLCPMTDPTGGPKENAGSQLPDLIPIHDATWVQLGQLLGLIIDLLRRRGLQGQISDHLGQVDDLVLHRAHLPIGLVLDLLNAAEGDEPGSGQNQDHHREDGLSVLPKNGQGHDGPDGKGDGQAQQNHCRPGKILRVHGCRPPTRLSRGSYPIMTRLQGDHGP